MLVVTHGGTIVATQAVLAFAPGRTWDLQNCAYVELEGDADGWRVRLGKPYRMLPSPRVEEGQEGQGGLPAQEEVLRLQGQVRRCPLLMLKHGTLPDGYTVKKRKLVKTGQEDRKKLPKAA